MKLTPILTYVDGLKNVLEDDKTPLDDGDRKFVESLLEVEISIMDKDAFTSTEESTEKIRKLFSSSSDEFAETQRKGQERHRQVNKYQLKEQGELRTQAHELAFPETTPTKIHKRLIAIIQHQADYQLKKIKEKKAEIQRLRDEIERIDGEQKKVLQVALEKAKQEMMDIMNQIGQTSYVSNLVKQIERAMKPFKIKIFCP